MHACILQGEYIMERIVKYLTNPLQAGVYYSQLTANFSALEKFLRDVVAIPKEPTLESKELTKSADSLMKEPEYYGLNEMKKIFGKAMAFFFPFKECPKEISQYLSGHEEIASLKRVAERAPKGMRAHIYSMITRGGPLEVFKSHIIEDVNDVIVIETADANVLLFEITTITEKGLSIFHNFLKCVPHIGDTVKEIRNRKTYSSRYTFRPYPLAVRLWLENEEAITVPDDLRDFLRGSIRYHSEEEWRTSIVLSAIAVESVLADLYEERFKEYAPNVPLGDLYHKVKEKIDFPSDIKGAIEMVNEARISAVHRSRFPVSDREATNALYGSTTFIMWYSANF